MVLKQGKGELPSHMTLHRTLNAMILKEFSSTMIGLMGSRCAGDGVGEAVHGEGSHAGDVDTQA